MPIRCKILTDRELRSLVKRYEGVGSELTRDEYEILLFALYLESERREGLVWQVQQEMKLGTTVKPEQSAAESGRVDGPAKVDRSDSWSRKKRPRD